MEDTTQLSPAQQGKRDFLKYLLAGSALAWLGSVIYPILSYLRPPKQPEVVVSSVKVGPLSGIPKDSGTIIRFGNTPVIVIRTPGGDVRAFSAVCTHLECTVQFRKDLGVIWCACHNGKYDLTGRNISGPPPRPLEPFRVAIQGGDVYVSKMT
jgi:cytochrome b6-f complex iron-sulfur subunit